jgi:hypothetical protein
MCRVCIQYWTAVSSAPLWICCIGREEWFINCTGGYNGIFKLVCIEITCRAREYELLTEAHAYFSVVLNCSRFFHPVFCLLPPNPCCCLPPIHSHSVLEEGKQLTGRGQQSIDRELEQFRTTESWAWASGNISYSLWRANCGETLQ